MTEQEAIKCKAYFRKHYGDEVIDWLIDKTGEDELKVEEMLANRINKDSNGHVIAGSLYAEGMRFKTAYKHRNCKTMEHYFGCECNGNPLKCPHSRCFEVVMPVTDKVTGRLIAFEHGATTCKKAAATLASDSNKSDAVLDKRISRLA